MSGKELGNCGGVADTCEGCADCLADPRVTPPAKEEGLSETGTRVYGASDDLCEFDGDFRGEVSCSCYGTDDNERGMLVLLSDGTALEVKYFGRTSGVWEVKVLRIGSLFERLEICNDEDADPYSDVAHFRPGIKWAYAAKEWQIVD